MYGVSVHITVEATMHEPISNMTNVDEARLLFVYFTKFHDSNFLCKQLYTIHDSVCKIKSTQKDIYIVFASDVHEYAIKTWHSMLHFLKNPIHTMKVY